MSATTKLKAVRKLATKRAGEYNLQPGYRDQARAFANELADGSARRASAAVRRDPSVPPQHLSPALPIRAHTNADR